MLNRVVIASKNPDKAAEMGRLVRQLGLAREVVEGLDWPEVPEPGPTLEENALVKARAVAAATGLPALADDTGLEVAALGGAPGVRTARFAGEDAGYQDNVEALLAALEGRADRTAVFRTVVALAFPDGTELVAEGRLEGAIAEVGRGVAGFGYDPVFEVDDRTLAELSPEEKDGVSHRRRALETLAEVLAVTHGDPSGTEGGPD